MSVHATTLFEFVGIVLPISFISLRILLDELDKITGIPEETTTNTYLTHATAMVALLAAAGWLAILDILTADAGVPFADVGYLLAAIGLSVPVWLLWGLRNVVDMTEYADET